MQKLPQISQICTDADCVILPQNSQNTQNLLL